MKENKLVELSMDFAIKIIKLCETIKGYFFFYPSLRLDEMQRFALISCGQSSIIQLDKLEFV